MFVFLFVNRERDIIYLDPINTAMEDKLFKDSIEILFEKIIEQNRCNASLHM